MSKKLLKKKLQTIADSLSDSAQVNTIAPTSVKNLRIKRLQDATARASYYRLAAKLAAALIKADCNVTALMDEDGVPLANVSDHPLYEIWRRNTDDLGYNQRTITNPNY